MEFYEIRIGTIYLSENGLAGGQKVKCEVIGWEDLLNPVAGNVRPNADGSPDLQLYAWTAGKQFEIKVLAWINQAQWEDLRDLQIDSLTNGTEFTVIGNGDTGNFSVTARTFPDKPFAAKEFWDGRIFEPIFRFITV